MEKDDEITFRLIVGSSPELPAWVRGNSSSVQQVRTHLLDKSFLDFLDEQIKLDARGAEWTAVLQKRRAALAELCGKRLLDGIVSEGENQCFIKIDPVSRKVLYWEIWETSPTK